MNSCSILITDDLLVSPDFFSYFSALRFLLDADPSVWCVSAWNDNGKEGYISIEENGELGKSNIMRSVHIHVPRTCSCTQIYCIVRTSSLVWDGC